MKYFIALLAAAATLAPVLADSVGDEFCNASPYSCPSNTNNNCNAQQKTGWDFSGLNPGQVSSYGGFGLSGFSCNGGVSRRYDLLSRYGSGGSISATCSQDFPSAPSFSCGGDSGVSSFSIDTIDISVEFDCRMEFWYTMPGGDICKDTHQCSASGSTVQNTQCAGATKVSFVYPQQPECPQSSCGITVNHVGWDCGDNQPTGYPGSGPSPCYGDYCSPTYSPPACTGYNCGGSSPSSAPASSSPTCYGYNCGIPSSSTSTPVAVSTPASSSPACWGYNCAASSTTAAASTTPSSTLPASSPVCTGYNCGVSSPSSAPAGSSTTCYGYNCGGAPSSTASTAVVVSITTSSSPVVSTTTAAAASTTPSSTPASSSPAGSSTGCTGYKCGPMSSPSSASSTLAASPSTSSSPAATSTYGLGTPSSSGSVAAASTTTPSSSPHLTVYQTTSTIYTTTTDTVISCASTVTDCPAESTVKVTRTVAVTTTVCPVTATMTGSASYIPPSSTAAAVSTSPTLPCPSVLPKCLNTWLHLVEECKSNSDTSCYCPSETFVENVFACLYAHGDSSDDIAMAVSFFQGICAEWIPSNPGLATGAKSITTCITVTGTPTVAPSYTVVHVSTTITVPCATGTGSTISTISTDVTVPQVTCPSGTPTGPLVPSTYAPSVPAQTTATGALPTNTAGPTPVTGGAGHVGAGVGLLLAVLAAAVAL